MLRSYHKSDSMKLWQNSWESLYRNKSGTICTENYKYMNLLKLHAKAKELESIEIKLTSSSKESTKFYILKVDHIDQAYRILRTVYYDH